MEENNKKSSNGVLKAVLIGAILAFVVGVLILVSGVLHRDEPGSEASAASSAESVTESAEESAETSVSANEIAVTSIPENKDTSSDSSAAESTEEPEGNGIIVCIDPGHETEQIKDMEPNAPGSDVMKQGVTSGTYGETSGKNEYEVNLEVSLKLRDELEERGYTVVMTREINDVKISNVERAQMATEAGADILVRIHCNGVDNHDVTGVLCYGPSSSNPYLSEEVIRLSQRLCELLQQYQAEATGQRMIDNIYQDNMTGINWATMPVSIVEMGFMTNPDEDLYLASEEGQAAIVEGLANGIDAYFAEYPKTETESAAESETESAAESGSESKE